MTDAATLPTPTQDLADLLERLGCRLFGIDEPLRQYVAWSHQAGIIELLNARGPSTIDDICSATTLNEAGADALLGVLASLALLKRSADARYDLTPAAKEYLVPSSPYYIGDELYSLARAPLPPRYLAGRPPLLYGVKSRLKSRLPQFRFGAMARLKNQHARNLSACVAAVRTGEFADRECIVDLAGGSGAFAIPLALEYPPMRIVLTELPEGLKNIRTFLAAHGLERRVELLGFDAFVFPWPIPSCDGIFIGNFLHGFSDATCLKVCRHAYERLRPGGKVWLHEMLWNENKDGPLTTALINAGMRIGGGKQRTERELSEMLREAGFGGIRSRPTAGAFALVLGAKSG